MDVLALVHQEDATPGTFAGVVDDHGHRLEVRSFALGYPPPAGAAARYGAVMIFGGSMQVDQDDRHPWLADERALVRDLVEAEVPTLGVCLGAQLIAQTFDADVGPASEPEVGWYAVTLTAEGEADPVFGPGPRRFAAYEDHSYAFALPHGAAPLAHGEADALQAYRVGSAAWGVQFHPEVTWEIVDGWIAGHAAKGNLDNEPALREETRASMPRWTAFGRSLCARFLEFAGR